MLANKLKGAVGLAAAVVEGWDISTASYLQTFSVAAQESTPCGIFFKPDGLKLYVIGRGADLVNEYNLGTAWDISTASYFQNLSVSSQETGPVGIYFKPDGTKMYIVGRDGDRVYEYNLGTAWDISTASYFQNFSVAAQDSRPEDLFFKPDGLKLYVIGRTVDRIYEYNVSTAWDISTASYFQNISVAAQDPNSRGLFFKPDGLKMYMVGQDNLNVNEYNLGTAWDISTASYFQNFDVSVQDTNPQGLFFKPDGTKMYVVGSTLDDIDEYDL